MSRNKINFNSRNKLSNFIDDEKHLSPPKELNIIADNFSTKPITFRARGVDKERLVELLSNVNKVNKSHPFNNSDLLRGIIMYALESDSLKVMHYIRKAL